jgi:hypothetical protein
MKKIIIRGWYFAQERYCGLSETGEADTENRFNSHGKHPCLLTLFLTFEVQMQASLLNIHHFGAFFYLG